MVAKRGGIDLMPEQGTKPVNKYLPPRRHTPMPAVQDTKTPQGETTAGATGFFAWVDATLDAMG